MDSDKLIFTLIGGITLIITAVIIYTSFTTQSPEDIEGAQILGDNPNYKGAENPTVTLVKFSDFACPFCSQFAPIVQNLVDQYPEQLRAVYRHYPIPVSSGSIPAARASEAAALQGKFWEYHDELFVNIPDYTQPDLERYAEAVGLDMDQFRSDFASSEVAAKVQQDSDAARSLRLSGTPSFFLVYPDGRSERVNLDQIDSLEMRISEVLGQASVDLGAEVGMPSGAPADMPENLPMQLILDLVNVQRDDIAPSQVEVVSVVAREWDSSALGCPQEDEMYAQVITPGYQAILEAGSEQFVYHTDADIENIVLCETVSL